MLRFLQAFTLLMGCVSCGNNNDDKQWLTKINQDGLFIVSIQKTDDIEQNKSVFNVTLSNFSNDPVCTLDPGVGSAPVLFFRADDGAELNRIDQEYRGSLLSNAGSTAILSGGTVKFSMKEDFSSFGYYAPVKGNGGGLFRRSDSIYAVAKVVLFSCDETKIDHALNGGRFVELASKPTESFVPNNRPRGN